MDMVSTSACSAIMGSKCGPGGWKSAHLTRTNASNTRFAVMKRHTLESRSHDVLAAAIHEQSQHLVIVVDNGSRQRCPTVAGNGIQIRAELESPKRRRY